MSEHNFLVIDDNEVFAGTLAPEEAAAFHVGLQEHGVGCLLFRVSSSGDLQADVG